MRSGDPMRPDEPCLSRHAVVVDWAARAAFNAFDRHRIVAARAESGQFVLTLPRRQP